MIRRSIFFSGGFLPVICLLILPATAWSMGGHIYDRDDHIVIAGALIKLQRLHKQYFTVTDFNGAYSFGRLPAGKYQIRCEATGYQKVEDSIILSGKEDQKQDYYLARLIKNLPEITIGGYTDNGSAKSSLILQQKAGRLVDIVAEETIARSTDLTIADVTRKVNGLSVTTDRSGQSDITIIRGMDPKYNYTLINGIKIPSPGSRSRYVPLAIFPASMVQRVEVYKTLTPDMEGDAIGGVVNMIMRNAPDKPLLHFGLSSGYNEVFFDRPYLFFNSKEIQKKSPYEIYGPSYRAGANDFNKDNLSFSEKHPLPDLLGSLMTGCRLWHGRAGLLLAADYQNIKKGTQGFFIPENNEPQVGNMPGLTDFYHNEYSATLIRKSLHTSMDYIFNTYNKLFFYQFYANQKDIESRYQVDTSLIQGRTIPGTGRVTVSNRSRLHLQGIYNATLSGDHQLGGFSVKWTTAYSIATGLYPDWAELSAGTARIEGTNGVVNQSPFLLDPLARLWLRNTEKDFSGYLHATHKHSVGNKDLILASGGLYRQKYRNSFYNSYIFQPAITSSSGQPFIDIYHAQWDNNNGPQNPLGAVANPNTYIAHEYIAAAYVSATLKSRKTEWVAGLRYENTHQEFVSSVDPSVSYGKQGNIRYHDFLPSINLKYKIKDKQALRLSWYRSISRPALYDVTFYSIQYEDYREAGNPFLKRSRADNLDLRYEWYPGGLNLLQVGVFYKHISDPYEKTLLNTADELYPIPDQGLGYTPAGQFTSQMKNASSARDYGMELSFNHYYGRWGIQSAYTYTYSHINQSTKFKTREEPNNTASNIITVTRNESRPLQGQSPNLANLSLIYRDQKAGWNVRLSCIYTGRRIYSVSGWYGLDYWQRGYALVDAFIEKKIKRRTRIFLKAANLFNVVTKVDLLQANPEFVSRLIPEQEKAERINVMRQTDQAVYYLGFQWNMP